MRQRRPAAAAAKKFTRLGGLARLWRGIPILQQKARAAFAAHYGKPKAEQLMADFETHQNFEEKSVENFCSQLSSPKDHA